MAHKTLNGVYGEDTSKVDTVPSVNISAINGVTWDPTSSASIYNGVIDYSCMFNRTSNSYLNRTGSVNEANITKSTISLWMKRASIGAQMTLISHRGNSNNYSNFYITSGDKLGWVTVTGGTTRANVTTNAVLRDCSGWYHICQVYDSTLGENDNAMQIYINGVRADLTFTTGISANEDNVFNYDAYTQYVGAYGAADSFDGYLAEVNVFTSETVAYTNFGEFSDGIWIPKSYTHSGNYNGYQLQFATNTNFGDDTSGSSDGDFTDNNFGTDHQVTDTPENNYCILDYNAMRSNMTALTEGGLSPQDAGAAWHSILGTFLLKSGKWYFEVDVGADADDIKAGIIAAGEYSGDIITADTDPGTIGYVLHCNASGTVYNAESSGGATGDDNLDAPAANDIMTIAIDCDAGKIWFGMKNAGSGHVWGDFGATGVGDPANGTNPTFSGLDFDLYDFVPVIGVNAHSTAMVNFGQRTFSGTQPSGFQALCTENMSVPTVTDPQDEYINVVTYTGDGTADQGITGVGFQSDFVWIKNRDQADAHQIFDSVRGATKYISADATTVETTDADTLLSFDADGFSVGADVKVNTLNEDYVAWCLQKQSNFFDIVSYEGTGAAHAESHNLGVAPELMIIKNLDDTDNWAVYHHGALNKTDPETDYTTLDVAAAWSDLNTIWNDTAPTTTQFTVGTHANVNTLNETYIAYLFASLAGISHVFSYEGNGNASGPYVYCGFRPKWIIIKNADAADSWIILDDQRDTYNQMDNYLVPDTTAAEDTTGENEMDFFANGFKLRNTDHTSNANNETYVGIAFSDQPFKWANAR